MLKKFWKRIKERRTIRKINKAFGFPLREYQIEYIFGRINFLPSNRQSGRTLAHCIRLCLSEGPPLDIKEELRKSGQPLTLEPYRGAEFETHYNSPHYKKWFAEELRRVYTTLKKSRVKVRTIIF